jgi:hypothetical protein
LLRQAAGLEKDPECQKDCAKIEGMSEMFPVVFLVDVDNTLLNNDQIQKDLAEHLQSEFGATCRDRYWKILEDLFEQLGYRDYLGALQRYRIEHPTDIRLLCHPMCSITVSPIDSIPVRSTC